MLPALVNILAIPMTVFTSAENMPVLSLLPITSVVLESEPIFLAYLHEGPGHSDAVTRDEKENKEPLEETGGSTKCTCGRKTTKGVSCAFTLDHYSTRCPCFKSNRACTSESLDAKDATILMVQDQSQLTRCPGKKRVRQRYDYQLHELKGERLPNYARCR